MPVSLFQVEKKPRYHTGTEQQRSGESLIDELLEGIVVTDW